MRAAPAVTTGGVVVVVLEALTRAEVSELGGAVTELIWVVISELGGVVTELIWVVPLVAEVRNVLPSVTVVPPTLVVGVTGQTVVPRVMISVVTVVE